MRFLLLSAALASTPILLAQDSAPAAGAVSEPVVTQASFHVRYVNNTDVYIDGGRNAGLTEGTQLVLKQDPAKQDKPGDGSPVDLGVVAHLKVVSVAATSAVCEVVSTGRDLVAGDVVTLPQAEVEKREEKRVLGNARVYPMVVSFT